MLRELISKGGFIMYPLLLCSVTALAVTLERALFFVRLRKAEALLADRSKAVYRLVTSGALSQVEQALIGAEGPMSRVIAATLAGESGTGRDIDMHVSAERRKLFAGLAILDTVVTASPLLGLLGTVTGIINTFRLLGAQPTLKMEAVGQGMAEALITTASGLIIAIPTLVALNYFIHRAETSAERLDRDAALLANALKERGGRNAQILDAPGQN